jgi:uncharacterized repeat protein (TIGR02543 family)
LTNINASINGLETPPTPSPVGKNFTVEIHLRNATVDNVANGVGGVEVHFNFTSILPHCQPTGFVDMTGQTGGVLVAPVLQAITAGFYKADGFTKVTTPPYTDAVLYEVAAATTGGAWNGADGLVAKITFQIVKQPQSSNGEPTASLALTNDFTDLYDGNAERVSHDRVQGTLTVDATPPPQYYTLTVSVAGNGTVARNPVNATYLEGTNVTLVAVPDVNWTFVGWSGDLASQQSPVNITMDGNKTVTATFVQGLPGDINHDGKVALLDLVILANAYGSRQGDTRWNPNADIDHNGSVGLTDLVIVALHYGQHYP